MAFIPVPDVVQAEIRMSLYGQLVENTLYFRLQDSAADTSLAGLGAGLLVWWNEEYRYCVADDLSLREIYLTDLTTESSQVHTQPAPAPAPIGTQLDPGLPGNVAMCVSFRTGQRGRSFRGRNYISGFVEPQVNENAFTAQAQTLVRNTYVALLAGGYVNADWEWGVVSRYSNGVARQAGIFTPVQSVIIVDGYVDSMRRRLNNRGI